MMKRCIILFSLLLVVASIASAEDTIAPGRYALSMEEAAQEAGLCIQNELAIAWNNLSLLDAPTNDALKSLLKSLRFQTRQQDINGNGFWGMNLMLQDNSVVDFAMQANDGIYYEQSNLLGGKTVAFTPDEFASFARKLSDRSGGALPQNLDAAYELLMMTLGGLDHVTVEMDTLDKALGRINDWEITALTVEERERPKTAIPGLYGQKARVMDISRDEMLSLVGSFGELLANEPDIWTEPILAQTAGDDASAKEIMTRVTQIIQTLPETLTKALPENMEPLEYREILGMDGMLVSKQLEWVIPGVASIFVEWVPGNGDIPKSFVSYSQGESAFSLLLSREDGKPSQTGNAWRVRNRFIAEFSFVEKEIQLDLMMTRIENVEQRAGKEIINTRTDWIAQSEALFGKDTTATLQLQEVDTASGEGKTFKRVHETTYFLKGFGFDDEKIMVATQATTVSDANAAFDVTANVIRPATMSDDELDGWLTGLEVSLIQVGSTCLGQLPSDVAAYILDRYF